MHEHDAMQCAYGTVNMRGMGIGTMKKNYFDSPMSPNATGPCNSRTIYHTDNFAKRSARLAVPYTTAVALDKNSLVHYECAFS